MSTFHTPVLPKEAVEGLDVREGRKYIDATVGGGAITVEIIKRGGLVLGIDRDQEAIEEAKKRLKDLGKAAKLVQGNFRDIEKIAQEFGFGRVDGVLFDLGVSSHQLNTAGRGFSYRFGDAPLDLRFNRTESEPAATVINHLSDEELYEILAKFGEEKRARAIARAVVRRRSLAPINNVSDLVSIVAAIAPKRELSATLSRVFQALRIAVNDELGALRLGLVSAEKLMVSGGRLVVISFHSLEDRLTKQFMRRAGWQMLTKKPIVASSAETAINPRSRSAKLRIAQKL